MTFSPSERGELVHCQELVRGHLSKGRPTARDNLHLTLCFIGACDADAEAKAREALDDAVRLWRERADEWHSTGMASEAPKRIDLPLGKVGLFEKRHGSVVWCGPREGTPPELDALRQEMASELTARGLPHGTDTFVPHVTIFRGAKAAAPRSAQGGHGSHMGSDALQGSCPVHFSSHHETVSLMWSHHPEGGALTYTPVYTVRLDGDQAG